MSDTTLLLSDATKKAVALIITGGIMELNTGQGLLSNSSRISGGHYRIYSITKTRGILGLPKVKVEQLMADVNVYNANYTIVTCNNQEWVDAIRAKEPEITAKIGAGFPALKAHHLVYQLRV